MYSFNWSGKEFQFRWWCGERLESYPFAPFGFDTETELIDGPLHIPALSLAIASDGKAHYLIHPSQAAYFWEVNKGGYVVFHNAAFDFWVLHKSMDGNVAGQRLLWDMVDAGRWKDTMLLDQLLQLGTGTYRADKKGIASRTNPANLGVLAKEYTPFEIDKQDPYRMRYGELVGLSREVIEDHPEFMGFASYAIKDAIVTQAVYPTLYRQATELAARNGWTVRKQPTYHIHPAAVKDYGPLTETVQVKASIALAHLSRQSLRVDQDRRKEVVDGLSREITSAVTELDSLCPSLFKRKEARKPRKGKEPVVDPTAGQFLPPNSTGLPPLSNGVLKEFLEQEAKKIGVVCRYSSGKLGGISTSTKEWKEFADRSLFIKRWVEISATAKMMSFLKNLDSERVWTKYDLLKATGRTSASKHSKLPGLNLQQAPKEAAFRNLFIADEGHTLISVDYSYLELRTLAAICKGRFGKSALADTITEHKSGVGVDPHQRTAASMLGLSVDEFLSLPKEKQKQARQGAKAVNFGYPGGLGVERFTQYAKAQYGVEVTPQQAKEFKRAWIAAYPEMKEYLADNSIRALAENLMLSEAALQKSFTGMWNIRDILRGDDEERERHRNIFESLRKRNKNLALVPLLEKGPSEEVADRLLSSSSVTPTGRVRARCGYTDGKNSPFQGLAADGGKEALWRLLYCGYDIKGFIHDEIIVQAPIDRSREQSERVSRIMIEAMERVCGYLIPVDVEATISNSWSK